MTLYYHEMGKTCNQANNIECHTKLHNLITRFLLKNDCE